MEQLTLFSEATHANLFPQPGNDVARKMTATSGRRCLELSKKSGPLGYLLKTLLATSRWASTLYLLTWKVKVTPARRSLFQLQASAPRTSEKGSLSWTTPIQSDYKRRGPNSKQQGLPEKVRAAWRTPQAANAGQGPKSREHFERVIKTGESQITLTDQVRHAWPTPTAEKGMNGGTAHRMMFEDAVKLGRMSEREKDQMLYTTHGGQLNPDWVEHLMGFPPGWTNTDGLPLSGSRRGTGKHRG